MIVQGPQYLHGKLNHKWLGRQKAIRSSKISSVMQLDEMLTKAQAQLDAFGVGSILKGFGQFGLVLQILLLGQHAGQALGLGLSTNLAIRLSPTTAGSVAIRDKVNLLLAFLRDMILFLSCFWADWDKGF